MKNKIRCRYCNKEFDDYIKAFSCGCIKRTKWSANKTRHKDNW